MGCPDFRGRSESSFHLVRELVSVVKPVKATVAAGPAAWNAPDRDPDRHHQQANQASRSSGVTRAATTLQSHDEELPRIPSSHRRLQARHKEDKIEGTVALKLVPYGPT